MEELIPPLPFHDQEELLVSIPSHTPVFAQHQDTRNPTDCGGNDRDFLHSGMVSGAL